MKLGVGAFIQLQTVRKNQNIPPKLNSVNEDPPTHEPDADFYYIHELTETDRILHVKLNFGPGGVR